jgi:peroxiredoxin
VRTRDQQVQRLFNQGVAQLHGFWYFEAERSFRQAAALDPDCVMTYWGMAMANVNNPKRAAKFMDEALKRRDKAVGREQMWVDAYAAFYKTDGKKDFDPRKDKKRCESLVLALEDIVHEYPDDVEAKAFLVLQIWLNRNQIPIASRQAVDALIEEVLVANPMHPVHHYRIHLWDDGKALRALGSAALCGQSTPGIAHMWHMPGHTFSKLERYGDAAWQQEAASRTDHAYMIRDYVLPDQIHNYAHNHEWLIRDLSHIGRSRYAVELAKNLTEMPRHPKYNTLTQKGTAQYGRTRLIEALQRFELWADAVALAQTPYLEPTDTPREQVKRLRLLGSALFELGRVDDAKETLAKVEKLLADEKAAQKTAGDKAADAAKKKSPAKPQPTQTAAGVKPAPRATATGTAQPKPADPIAKARQDAENPFRAQIAVLEAAVAELQARDALRENRFEEALKKFKAAGVTSGELMSRVQVAAGNKTEAERLARDATKRTAKQVAPLANLIYVLWNVDKQDEATTLFEDLRTLAHAADLKDVPMFDRLRPIAAELGWPEDWRTAPTTPTDVGLRPSLDALGPIRWTPPAARDFELTTADGKPLRLADYRGRNAVFILYLGFGCLHCVDQLKAFAPLDEEFQAAGIDVVAIGTDTPEALAKAQATLADDEKYPFTIVSDSDLGVFKKYRAYDDFEHQPLHATVLVDALGKVRWLDIGPDPFSDAKFLLQEAKRLLSLKSPSPEATVGPLME